MSDSREFRPARVVERRKKIDPPAKDDWDYEYYMHFIGFNRRMDEWHDLEDMDPRKFRPLPSRSQLHCRVRSQ